MPFNKRVVSDEYHFESVDETTVKYPVAQPQSTVVHHHHPAPPAAANTTTSYFTRASPAYSSFSSCLKPHQRSLSRGSTSCIPAATECASNIVDIKIDDDTHCRIKPEVYQVHHHHHHEPRPTLRTVTYDTAVVKPVKRRSVSRSTLYDDGENVIDIKVEKNEADAIECTSICSRPRSSSRNRCSALNNSSTNSIVDIKVNTDQCGSETTKITRYETAPRLSRSSSFYDRKNTIDIKFETKEEEKVVCEPVCTTPAVSTYSTCTPSYRVASIPAAATCTTTTTTKNPCSSGYVVTTRERSTSPCKTTNSYVIRSTSPCAPCAPAPACKTTNSSYVIRSTSPCAPCAPAPACKTTNSSYVIRSTSPCAPCAPAPVCVSTPTCSTSNNNYVVTTTTRERSVSPCKPVVSNCTVRETKSTCVPDRITGRSINYLVNHRESSTSPCKTFVKPCPATSSQYHNSYVVTTRERSASPCKRTTSNYVVTTRERSTSPCKPATTSYVCAPTTTSCNPCNTAASTNNYTVTTTTRERSVSPCVRRSTYVHTEPAAPCTPCPPARNNYVVTTTTRERSLSPCIKRTSCVTSEPPCNPCNTTNSYVVTSRQRSPSPCAARSNSYVIRTARRGCTPPPCVTTTTTAAPCTNNSYIVSSREATTGCDYQTYKYNYSETESSTSRRLNSLLSKSCTSLAGNKLVERPRVTFVEPPKITYVESCPPPKVHATVLETKTATYKPEPCTNSLTYVYNLANTSAASACASKSSVCKTSCASTSSSDEEEGRVVSYVKHHVDTGCNTDNTTTLAGCLVKAQPAVSPACRSVCLGTPFDGSCFGLLTEHCRIKDSFNVSFDFRTGSRDGVMLIVVDAFTNDSFFIELCDSQLKATLFVNGEPDSCWTQFPSPVLTNDSWVDVNFELTGSKLSLCVKDQHLTKYHRCNLRYPIRGDLFVAGFPSYLRLPFACRSRDFFRGEMRNFLVNHEGIKFYGTPSFIQPRLRKWY